MNNKASGAYALSGCPAWLRPGDAGRDPGVKYPKRKEGRILHPPVSLVDRVDNLSSNLS